MNEFLIERIRNAGGGSSADTVAEVSKALVEATGPTLTVRGARDTFSKVLKRAKDGEMQVIGQEPGEMTIVMSLRDLVDVVRQSERPRTMGDALAALGFTPKPEPGLVVRRGRRRNRLRIPGTEPSSSNSM